jgi:hypothetical protein
VALYKRKGMQSLTSSKSTHNVSKAASSSHRLHACPPDLERHPIMPRGRAKHFTTTPGNGKLEWDLTGQAERAVACTTAPLKDACSPSNH